MYTAVPTGGTTGQVITKTSSDDYETEWSTIDALPSQSVNDGKYLVTNGSTASWTTVVTGADPLSAFLLAGC
jgi:hypothetical protein